MGIGMARKDESILEVLALFPWWVSVCFSAIVFVILKFVIPSITFDNPILKSMAQIAPQFAWVSAVFLLPAAASAFESFRKRKLFERQSGIESIRALPWKHFEELMAEAYRRQGYVVKENASHGADGGVDLRIEKSGDRFLVQCKQWRKYKVGVKTVREMYGLMAAEHAAGAIIVTSGFFTQEAKNFAFGKPVDLMEGSQLATLIQNTQSAPGFGARVDRPLRVRSCPRCGGELLIREAKRGKHPGSKFWGCSSFLDCRYTEKLDRESTVR
jgi:restriction system protein